MIPYSGDHVVRVAGARMAFGSILTICRIEPENNIEMLIEGFLKSSGGSYCFVGNWSASEYGRTLRDRYRGFGRLKLLDPIYDPNRLAEIRENCSIYLHGHSVGGTNPSLVEMVFYDCRILCFDVPYHRETVGDAAEYFSSAEDLAALIAQPFGGIADRQSLRRRYSAAEIVGQLMSIFSGR